MTRRESREGVTRAGRLGSWTPSGRSRTVALIGAVVASVALGACSSTDATTTADGKTILTVQGWKGSDTEPANIEEINAAFEKANPDIKVEFEYVPPNDAYLQKLQPAFLAGNAADVVMTDVTQLPGWTKAGYLMDLSDQSWVADVDPALAPAITIDSKVYAQPMEVIAEGLYANMDLLEKAGISEVPATWDQFEKDLATLKAKGIDPIELPNKAGDTAQMALNGIASTLVYQDDPEWDTKFNAGEASFTDWQPALDQLASLEDDGYVDFKQSLGVDEWSDGLNDFAAGKYAFWFQGAWMVQALEKAGLKNFTLNPWPAGASGVEPSVGVISGTSWSINAQAKAKDAAEKYLEFWSDPANARPFLDLEQALSPWAGAENPSGGVSATVNAAYADGRYHLLARDSWLSAEGNKTIKSKLQGFMLGQYSSDDAFLTELDSSLRPAS